MLYTDSLTRDEVTADVKLTTGPASQRVNASAVVRLRRFGSDWKIVDVQLLETGESAAVN